MKYIQDDANKLFTAVTGPSSMCAGLEWPAGNTNDYLLAHEDCTKFWSCTAAGTPYEMNCPAGLHFSVAEKRCEWPEVAGCTPTENKPEKPINPDMCDGVAWPAGGTNNYLLPHEDCTKFWSCTAAGTPVEMNCPAGLHWNDEKKFCDWPEAAGCAGIDGGEDGGVVGNRCDGVAWPAGGTNDYLLPHEDCTKFWSCTAAGTPVEMNCPSGLQWNDAEKLCDWPEVAGCSATDGGGEGGGDQGNMCDGVAWPAGGTNDYLLPHEDCTKFWSCTAAGTPVEMNCPAGLHWNNVEKMCDWPDEARCSATDPPKPTEGNGEGNMCDGVAWPAGGTNNYLLPHEDCTKFWSCTAAGTPVEMDCPAGLHWNNAAKMCDWAENAGCVAVDEDNGESAEEGSEEDNNEVVDPDVDDDSKSNESSVSNDSDDSSSKSK